MKIKVIGAIAGVLALGGGAYALGGVEDAKVELTDPQKVVWEKPKNDAEWAEDVKAENFDIKSTPVLQEMIVAHTAKLNRFLENDKLTACPECFKFDLKERHPELSQKEIDAQYQDLLDNYLWTIEKLKQSIERMEKEISLRQQGKVNRQYHD